MLGMKRTLHSDSTVPGFQIAPMIDVVFVIMLFFMVMVGTMKIEREISIRMPGPNTTGHDIKFPDAEITIGVEEDGTVTLNEQAFDSPRDKSLPELARTLNRLALQQQKTLVTVQAEAQASYERVMDVLNSLHKARMSNVTFAVGEL